MDTRIGKYFIFRRWYLRPTTSRKSGNRRKRQKAHRKIHFSPNISNIEHSLKGQRHRQKVAQDRLWWCQSCGDLKCPNMRICLVLVFAYIKSKQAKNPFELFPDFAKNLPLYTKFRSFSIGSVDVRVTLHWLSRGMRLNVYWVHVVWVCTSIESMWNGRNFENSGEFW